MDNFTITLNSPGGTRTFRCADPHTYSVTLKIFKGETYNFDLYNSFIAPGSGTIVDIGANMGAFSLLAAFKWPGSRILSFEPGAQTLDCLHENLAGLNNVEVFDFGLGQGDSRSTLYSSVYGTVGASVGASGLNGEVGEDIQVRDAGTTLSGLGVAAIDILKIDTEGCEIPILTSVAALIPHTSVILLEYHSEEDRRTIDRMLAPTHHLVAGTVPEPHRGEFCFVHQRHTGPWEKNRIQIAGS